MVDNVHIMNKGEMNMITVSFVNERGITLTYSADSMSHINAFISEQHLESYEIHVKTLEFKMDASLDDEMDTFIPEGTVVNVWPGPQREGSTRIIYNGQVIEYMNFSFKEVN